MEHCSPGPREAQGGEPPVKRKRVKGPLACDSCRKRRSRCDSIDHLGCYRCKQLGTDCTFKTGDGSTLPNHGGELVPSHGINHSEPGMEMIRDPESSSTIIYQRETSASYGQDHNRLPSAQQPTFPEYSHIQPPPPTQPQSESILSSNVRGPSSQLSFQVNESSALTPSYSVLQARIVQLERALDSATSSTRGQSSQRLQTGQDILASFDNNYHSPVSLANNTASGQPLRREEAVEERDEAWFLGTADPENFGLMHRGMKGKEEQGLKDPVAEGILTKRQAEAAYQIFKHHIIDIFPHPSFLNMRSRLPTHPFLRSACLIYVSRCVPDMTFFGLHTINQLEAIVADNLMAYLRGCRASLEGIMAAYILSLMPHEVTGKNLSDWDPARMIGQAYGQTREMGHTLSSDRLLDTLASGTPLHLLQETLDAARLYMIVMARIVWFSIVRCPQSTVPAGLDNSQRRLLSVLEESHSNCELDRHTIIEHSCLEILVNSSRGWHLLERIKTPTAADVQTGNDVVLSAMRQFDLLRAKITKDHNLVSLPYLLCHITYCKWWVAARNFWFAFRLPSPLYVEDTYNALLRGMEVVGSASRDVLVLCLRENWNLSSMPKAIGTAVVLCFLTISTGIIHLQHHHPGRLLPDCLNIPDILEYIQIKLASSGPTLTGMLERTKENVEEYRMQLAMRDMMMHEQANTSSRGTNGVSGSDIVVDLLAGTETWWDWQIPGMDDGLGTGGVGMTFGGNNGGFM